MALTVIGVLVASAAAEPPGLAPPPSAVVRWRAPARCPDETTVRSRIDARLDRPLASGDVIEADVEVVRERRGFRARVTVWTPAADAERELRAPDCGAIADAVAVVVARAVAEARAVAPPPAPPSMIEVAPAVAARMIEVRPRVRVARVVPPPRWSVAARLQLGTDAGVVPRMGMSSDLAVIVSRGELGLELEARRWRDRFVELSPGSGAGAAIRLDALAGRVCWQRPEVGPRACLILERGTMTGTSFGVADGRAGSAPWSAVGFGLSLRTPIWGRALLVSTFEMLRAGDRPRFILDAGTGLHQPDLLCGRIAAGIEVPLF